MVKKVVALALGASAADLRRSDILITRGIVEWAQQSGWDLLDLRAWRLQIPSGTKVDGLIYNHSACGNDPKRLTALLKAIPCNVCFPRQQKGARRGIVDDRAAIGLQAAEYFLDRGFRSFALASYHTNEWVESLRVFKKRIEDAGGYCEAIQGMHLDGKDLNDVRDSVKQQLHQLTYPLGIFCANDRLAVRLCHWCLEEGIAIPEQAAILGYGNDILACLSNPVPLSSVNPDHKQRGVEAARLLQRMMDGEDIPEDTVIHVPPHGVVTRRSTDITAVADPRTARALRYIWDHFMDNIGPDQVAAFCAVPRRTLDRNFKRALGRTMSKEIMRQRFARASELLTGGDMSAADIASRVGFRTPQYFNFQFKKHFGLTPQRYRERERKQR